MKQILLIEAEKILSRFIELELVNESYSVTKAFDGNSGLILALKRDWDIILLDVMLPDLNGFEVCRRIRSAKETPILILTSENSVADRVLGLDSGADDTLSKPFAIEELFARIRVQLRRIEKSKTTNQAVLKFRTLLMFPNSLVVKKEGKNLDLTKREFDLLQMFMRNINRVLSRDVLLDKIWGFDTNVKRSIVDVYIRFLRSKIDRDNPYSFIHTLHGVGYVMR